MSDLPALIALGAAEGLRVYPFGEVPRIPQTPYVVVSVDVGTPTGERLGGVHSTVRRDFVCQVFAKTADGLLDAALACDAAWKDRTITGLPGQPFSQRKQSSRMDRDAGADQPLGLVHVYQLT